MFEGSDANYYTGKQILHYIGIPLNLKYNIFTWKRLMLYVSVGGLAEKCISAKIDKEFTLENKTQRKEKRKYRREANAVVCKRSGRHTA